MKKYFLIFPAFLVLMLVSCAPGREKMISRINEMETKLKSSAAADTNTMKELMSACQTFVSRFPSDTLAPLYLYKSASVAVGLMKGEQAIDLYSQLIDKYPTYKKVPESYFMKAFIYENLIGNLGKASEFYNIFISKFPDHQLAGDAAASLKNLGKSPDELVKEFEQKNDSAQAAN